MDGSVTITLDWKPIGGTGRVAIIARSGNDLLDTDKLDVNSAAARCRYAKRLAERFPGIDRAEIEAELLRVAGEIASAAASGPHQSAAIDITRLIRPDLFHTLEVSGIAIPVVRIINGKPSGSWETMCRWHADGRRDRRDMETSIELGDGGRLWIHPMPGEPEPTSRATWTSKSRISWLAGSKAPDPAELLKRICERFDYFLDFSPDAMNGTTMTLALWTVLTYAFPIWSAVPYLNVGGPQSSGKSQLFHVLSRLIFRPLQSSNMTAACLFRTLHERGGTLLLDEAERLRDGTPDAAELRSILLSGYKVGSPASRLEKVGDGFKRVEFECYGPKALAAIASLPEALMSRCIRVGMFRASEDSPKPRRQLDEHPEQWDELRDNLHIMALENGAHWIAISRRSDFCPPRLNGRDFELWQPLLALAAWFESCGCGGLLDTVRTHAEHAVEATREDAVPETDELLLRLLTESVVAGSSHALKAGELLRRARDADPTTFKTWTAKRVASALGRYGLRTRKGTGNTGRVYSDVTLVGLQRVQRAYGFELGISGEEVPHVPQAPQVPIGDDYTSPT